VGAGGAGFPAYVKMQAKGVDTVIVNAAECEPLLHKDKELLKKHAGELMEVLGAIVRHLGAKAGIVGIKEKYHDVIETLKGQCGPGLSVHPLQDFYPAGDEFSLVYEVTGRVIPPGQIPLAVNAVVSNVETLLNIAWDKPVTHKYLTVAGAVKTPVTIRVPIGVTFNECLELAGGAACEGPFAVLDGGAMMGKLVEDMEKPVTRTTGGLIVVPVDHDLVRRRQRPQVVIDQIGRSACDQCSFCTELCPRFLLGHPIEPHLAMRNLGFHEVGDRMILGTSFCCECNLCTLYSCPEDLDPKNACVVSKGTLRTKGMSWPKDDLAKRVIPHPMEKYRHIPVKKLMLKLGLSGFENTGPLIDRTVEPKSVRVLLQQHVGAPATPVVKAGERVEAGQMLGDFAADKLGVPVHAPLAGVVKSVDQSAVVLEVR
jgi:Na+-translocating ferredoxin:NAD+ oxidoreductase RnfC subunit